METKMETQQKITESSRRVIKWANVIKVLATIGIVFSAIGTLATSVIYGFAQASDAFISYVEKHLDIADHIRVSYNVLGTGIVQIGESQDTLAELYKNGELMNTLHRAISGCFSALISCILVLVLVKIIIREFRKLAESDTPFTYETLKSLKSVFIILTIFSALNSIAVGLIVGLTCIFLYHIMEYGCELQTESDETL